MPRVTYFVTQPFYRDAESGHVYPGTAVEVSSKAAAERALETRTPDVVGAVAFFRTGDPEAGDWEDARVIGISGEVINQAVEDSLPW